MITRLRNFQQLRKKGLRFIHAAQITGLSRLPFDIIFGILALLATLVIASFIDDYGNDRESTQRRRADLNLKAFNMCMKGQPILIEDGRVLFTEKALELRL